jgi:hypothetical protein
VRKILLNPRNAGLATYKGEVIGKAAWEPIITPETYTLLAAKLNDPSRLTRTESRGRKPSNLLTGIARCATCDEPVTAGTGHKGRPIYECKSYHVSTPRDEADRIVRDTFAMTVATVRPGLLMPIPERGVPALLWEEANKIQDRMNVVTASFAKGAINEEALTAATSSLREQADAIQQQIAEEEADQASPWALRGDSVKKFLDLDLNGQRAILARLAIIKLYPRGRGRRNVRIQEQVTMHLRATRKPSKGRFIPESHNDGSHLTSREYLIAALDEQPGQPDAEK